MGSGDFSWFALFLAGLATVTQAYTQPKGDEPSGNSILKPGLNEPVPAGKPYEITWVATTPGTVSLLLLHGESTDMQTLYPIVENLPNIGKYTWTPKTDIAPETTHYGIQLICDQTGQYQYSTQFGVSNPSYSGSKVGTSSSSSVQVSATTPSSSSASTSETETVNTTSTRSVSLASSPKPTLTATTGFPVHNSSIIHPTGSLTSLSLKTTSKVKQTSTTVLSTSALATTRPTSTASSTTEASTVSEGIAAMYTAAGGVVALAAAAVLAL